MRIAVVFGLLAVCFIGCRPGSEPRREALHGAVQAELDRFPYGKLVLESVELASSSDSTDFRFVFRVDSLEAHYTTNWLQYVDPILWEGRFMRQRPRQGERFRGEGEVQFSGTEVRSLRLRPWFERLTGS
jgi:hypothetical protein|nr:MAG: hypothetical protein KatS3mg041_1719 [Bacteroidota bacterium]